jgi:hypothetical protein
MRSSGHPQLTAAMAVGIMGGASFIGRRLPAGWSTASTAQSACSGLRPARLVAFYPAVRERVDGAVQFRGALRPRLVCLGPATTTIIARTFGAERVGRIFGLVFVFHQLGGASAAVGGGWARVHFGDYQYAFLVGGCMGLIAACLTLTIRRPERPTPVLAAATELAEA